MKNITIINDIRRLSEGYSLSNLLLLQFKECSDMSSIIINMFVTFTNIPILFFN